MAVTPAIDECGPPALSTMGGIDAVARIVSATMVHSIHQDMMNPGCYRCCYQATAADFQDEQHDVVRNTVPRTCIERCVTHPVPIDALCHDSWQQPGLYQIVLTSSQHRPTE